MVLFSPAGARKKLETYLNYGGKSHHLSGAFPRAKVLPEDAQNREGAQEEPEERRYQSIQNRTRPARSTPATPAHRPHTTGSPALPAQRTKAAPRPALSAKRFGRWAVAYSRTDHATASPRPVRIRVFPCLPHVRHTLGSRHNIAFFDRDEAFTDLIDLPDHHH